MQEILDLVRYVAVFYLLEQMVIHLLPGKTYERYVRFYLGLLLVLLLLNPVFQILKLTEQIRTDELIYELEQEVDRLR